MKKSRFTEEQIVFALKQAETGSHKQLKQHLADFAAAYNFARRLKALRSLASYKAICKQ